MPFWVPTKPATASRVQVEKGIEPLNLCFCQKGALAGTMVALISSYQFSRGIHLQGGDLPL
jgi:hypothetical protein